MTRIAGSEAPKIPRHLSETAARVDRGDVREWVATLPEVVADLAERWALHVGKPYEPGGQCSWVAPARTVAGEDLVLKVGWRHPEAAHEADALRVWRGNGAVWLHAAETFDRTSALLLERCAPGMPMGRSTPEPEQDVVVAGLLARLWTQPPAGHPFRPLQAMCEDWAAEFEERFARSAGGVDPGLARAAMVLFRELPRSADSAVLLCTDLHAGNVLAAQREPWLVIDPKPYVGDRTYDALQHMLNCEERLVCDPSGFAQRMAALLDLDAERLRLWLFARCLLECLDQPVLHEVAARLAP
jgi:streptomycin 6-kinase